MNDIMIFESLAAIRRLMVKLNFSKNVRAAVWREDRGYALYIFIID